MKNFIITILISAFLVFVGCVKKVTKPIEEPLNQKKEMTKDIAISLCKNLYNQKKALGENMSDGPCLSNSITEDWVCDVAHSPRQAVDNKPENQCSAFREGKVHHFVELNIDGELIKAQ